MLSGVEHLVLTFLQVINSTTAPPSLRSGIGSVSRDKNWSLSKAREIHFIQNIITKTFKQLTRLAGKNIVVSQDFYI